MTPDELLTHLEAELGALPRRARPPVVRSWMRSCAERDRALRRVRPPRSDAARRQSTSATACTASCSRCSASKSWLVTRPLRQAARVGSTRICGTPVSRAAMQEPADRRSRDAGADLSHRRSASRATTSSARRLRGPRCRGDPGRRALASRRAHPRHANATLWCSRQRPPWGDVVAGVCRGARLASASSFVELPAVQVAGGRAAAARRARARRCRRSAPAPARRDRARERRRGIQQRRATRSHSRAAPLPARLAPARRPVLWVDRRAFAARRDALHPHRSAARERRATC